MKACTQCGAVKSLEEFPRDKRTRDGRNSWCKRCVAGKAAAWRAARPDYTPTMNAARAEKYRTDPEYRAKHSNRVRRYRLSLRAEVYSHYSARCVCCGEDELPFLSIEHVNGDGAEHRKANHNDGLAILRDIRRRGFPPEFEILCHNCNHGRWLNGGTCPHQS